MKLRISEKMDSFFDNDIQMEDVGVVDADRVRELTMAKLGISQPKASRRPGRKLGRTLLIAAAVVMALSAAAVAVYQYGMKDRVVEEHLDSDGTMYSYYSPVGLAPQEETASAETEVYSLEGGGDGSYFYSSADSSHAEFFALQEWMDYFFYSDHEEDYDVLLPQDDPYRDYGIGWEGVAEKLEEIAAKYSLRLYENGATVAWLDEFYEVSGLEPFLPLTESYSEDFGCTGYLYDEGSFQLNAVKTPYSDNEDEVVSVGIYRAMKGTFCSFFISGDEPSEYTYETYVTEAGFEVDIALGKRYSMIFAELDNCYVTTFVNGGVEPGQYLTLLEMDDMKYIADSTDYALLNGKSDEALSDRVAEEEKNDEAYMAEQQAKMDTEEAAYYASVSAIIEELGRFEITEIPDGYTDGEMVDGVFSTGVPNLWVSDSQETYASAFLIFTYNDSKNPTAELYYERWWEDESKEVSVTDVLYEDCKAFFVETYPEQCTTDLSVNGGDAFARIDDMYIELIWMDEVNDLRFSLMCRNNGMYTLDDVIAIAESVEKQ